MPMTIHFHKLSRLFREHGVIREERAPAWAIALGLASYTQGLSLRRTALLLAPGESVSPTWGYGIGFQPSPTSGPSGTPAGPDRGR